MSLIGRAKVFGFLMLGVAAILSGCESREMAPLTSESLATPDYRIGPGDSLNIFVWRNPELSMSVPVRPDGKISTPLVEDMQAANKTPTELARDMEVELSKFVQDPIVTIIVNNFVGPFDQQVRVVGEAAQPRAIPYREKMTMLDVMIEVGGLTEFAAGNEAIVVRKFGDETKSFGVRLDDLIKDGDVTANAQVLPGDVLIIPQSWF
ncbi:MAG: sugar ABC transporter substrate-binding protein [Rhodospirillaceae bacterium]|jgi:polysaccharide export outer membrane protein|nr:sugar ABC transporter substrate-binding protein [Rhodospirillaceae bacterium]|tara:strand:- start:1398 stop:2018 length:621 start_codon:yes stop_codon:yes gene_type:complete